MRPRPFRLFALMCTVVLATALSACSSDDDDTSTDASSADNASSDAPEATGTPIKIMHVSTLDQPQANQPEGVAAAKAAVLAVNEGGGVNGHPIEMEVCNNKFDPNESVTCARKAADGDYVAVVGGWWLPGDAEAVPIVSEAGIANIGMTPVALVDAAAENWFPVDGGVYSGYPSAGTILEQYAPDVESVAIVRTDTAASENAANLVAQGLDYAGLENAGIVTVPFDATDFSSYAATIEEDGADAAVFVASADLGIAMLRAMSDIGLELPFVAPNNGFKAPEVAAIGPIADKGFFYAATVPPGDTDHPGMAQMLSELEAAGESGVENTSPEEMTGASFSAWLAVHLFAEVAKGIDGEVTREGVMEAMSAAQDVDLFDVMPAYSAPPGPDPTVPRLSANQIYVFHVEDDVMQLADPDADPINIYADGFRVEN